MPLPRQMSIKSQPSQGKWDKVAKWQDWTLIEAATHCPSRARSFHFLLLGFKLIGMNFLWPESKHTERPTEWLRLSFCRVLQFSLNMSCKALRKQNNKQIQPWLVILCPMTPFPWGFSINQVSTCPSPSWWHFNYSLWHIAVTVSSSFKILCFYLLKLLNIKYDENSPLAIWL